MPQQPVRGALTFLGFAISLLSVLYFALEYIVRVSEWSQLAALILLALFFAFLGGYLERTLLREPFFQGPRLRWLRPAIVLYLLAVVSGIAAEFRFLGIDDVTTPVKVLASLVLGVGLIAAVATRRGPSRLPPAGPRATSPRGRKRTRGARRGP